VKSVIEKFVFIASGYRPWVILLSLI